MIKLINTLTSLIHQHYTKIFIVLIVFYYIFPQALGILDRSFILFSGIVSVGLYALHRFPFVEVKNFIIVFFIFIFYCILCCYLNNFYGDFFWESYIRSQMAWFFTAYAINLLIFKLHKNPRADILVAYLIVALTLQCVITFVMSQNPEAKEFFYSLQLQVEINEEMKEAIENQRLFGYGANLFGAGMVCGYCLILIMYVIIKNKLSLFQLLAMSLVYAFVFYIGLFMARTTIVGAAVSFSMFLLLFLRENQTNRKQGIRFIAIMIGLMMLGYSLAYEYFPKFASWAFEMWDTFQATGKLETSSSKSLASLFYLPDTKFVWFYGTGNVLKTDSDVGYTRLLFYVGLPGLIFYFAIGVFLGKKCLTRDWNMNFLVIITVLYIIILNYKGLTDMNLMLYLYFFFFLFYKYYVYNPKIYAKRMHENRQLLEESKTQ